MKKLAKTRLTLARETLVSLTELRDVHGGDGIPPSDTLVIHFCTVGGPRTNNCPRIP